MQAVVNSIDDDGSCGASDVDTNSARRISTLASKQGRIAIMEAGLKEKALYLTGFVIAGRKDK